MGTLCLIQNTSGLASMSKPAPGPLSPGLYLVATPIGNARDMGLRALDVLAGVSVVACEDTRKTGRLLARFGVSASLVSYHEHNALRMRPKLMDRIADGASVALVSDAGMPTISDPGHKLVRACIEAEQPVTAVPGPMAGLTALVLSGLPTDRFLFAGFPPNRGPARRRVLEGLVAVPASLIFQESPRRLAASLSDMAAVLGDRQAAVARELTKMHEEVRRGSLVQLADHYATSGPPRGETVVVVAPPESAAPAGEELDRMIRERRRTASLSRTAAEIAAATGISRRVVYERALALEPGHSVDAERDPE